MAHGNSMLLSQRPTWCVLTCNLHCRISAGNARRSCKGKVLATGELHACLPGFPPDVWSCLHRSQSQMQSVTRALRNSWCALASRPYHIFVPNADTTNWVLATNLLHALNHL